MKIHQILTSRTLDYEFYLSIVSALKVHQPEELNLWVVNPPDESDRYFGHIKDKVVLRQIPFDFVDGCNSFDDWATLSVFEGENANSINMHLKDVISYRILHEEGGLHMDLDTLSIHNCTPFFDNCKHVHLFKLGSPYPDSFNPAIMIAQPGSVLMWEVYEAAKEVLQGDSTIAWASTGPDLLNSAVKKYLPDEEEAVLSFTKEGCIVDGTSMGKIMRWLSDDGFVWNRCRILHIYRSCPYTQQVQAVTPLDEIFVYKSKSPYARLVKEILSPEEWNPNNVLQPAKTTRRIKTFHIPGLAHLPTNRDESSCAYTQKTIKLASMLKSMGHRVHFYGLEGSDVECDEFIQVATKAALVQTYGERTDENQFYNTERGIVHEMFYENSIREINKRKRSTDFLLATFGWGQKPIADGVQLPLTVESGIGYMDTFSKYRVFESSAWMHYLYGKTGQKDGANYDVVIPNYFNVNDFEFSEKKENYFLYLGRLIGRKGIEIAIQVAEHVGTTLKVAGQHCGENINLDRPHIEYVGYADMETRKQLLKNAKALFVPTMYIGPFEGVHVEAWLSGTPVITSDHGVFLETVLHGTTGYRCTTFEEYVWAANNVDKLKPIDCYNYATKNYSMEHVTWMYEAYFDRLLDIFTGKGWYELHPDRGDFDAWTREFPV